MIFTSVLVIFMIMGISGLSAVRNARTMVQSTTLKKIEQLLIWIYRILLDDTSPGIKILDRDEAAKIKIKFITCPASA